MFAYLTVLVVGFLGGFIGFFDTTYIRFYVSICLGIGFAALGYWFFLPEILPLWPGIVIAAIAGMLGLVWESRAAKSSNYLRNQSAHAKR